MSTFAFDTTALVALERRPYDAKAFARAARERGRELRVTAVAMTEFLGGAAPGHRPSADYVSSLLLVADVNEGLARRAATLQRIVVDSGDRSKPSPIDAIVAADAEESDAWLVVDGDRAAFRALAEASGRLGVVELRELI